MSRRLSETQSGPGASPGVAPKGRGANAVLSLQRMAGNRAVAGLMRSPKVGGGTAQKIEITVKGATQGAFKGDQHGAFAASGFHMGVTAPKDPAGGQAVGKHRNRAISFKKQLDAASPQFLTAADTNEVLTEVRIVFGQTDLAGKAGELETIVLKNASVASFDQDSDDGSNIETVSLVYESMVMSNIPGGTTAQDDPGGPSQ